MADKIVVMRDGRVEQIGAPLELYDQPASVFVAGFIGSPSMNFLHGQVALRDGQRVFVTDGGMALPLPACDLAEGHAVTYGIRPEHIGIADHGIPVTVVVTEPTGSETQVFARVEDELIDAVVRDRIHAQPGERIGFVIDPANVHLFDRATERRI